jgi:hypothetical protein
MAIQSRQKLPNEKPLNRGSVHEKNRQAEQRAHQHENLNPRLGNGKNPIHNSKGRK